MTDIEPLLWHMQGLARRSGDDWGTGFARSILRNAKRRNWRPSDKQLAVMQRLVAERLEDDDIQLIEEF